MTIERQSARARSARCLREAEGHIRLAQQAGLDKNAAEKLIVEARRLMAKAVELDAWDGAGQTKQ